MKHVQSNTLDFSGQNIYVGIDVHLKSWSVAIHKYWVSDYLGATYFSIYEAGFCSFQIHERLTDLGINNIVINTADVPTMSKEKLRKTDIKDCNKLAHELRSGSLERIYVPRADILEILSLIGMRDLIVKQLSFERNTT